MASSIGEVAAWAAANQEPENKFGPATEDDRKAGYDYCMFCVEVGPENHSVHDVLWDRWLDAENSAF